MLPHLHHAPTAPSIPIPTRATPTFCGGGGSSSRREKERCSVSRTCLWQRERCCSQLSCDCRTANQTVRESVMRSNLPSPRTPRVTVPPPILSLTTCVLCLYQFLCHACQMFFMYFASIWCRQQLTRYRYLVYELLTALRF